MTAQRGQLRSYRSGDVAVIVLDRPSVFNAVGATLLTELAAAIAESGDDAGAVVLAAEGRHFCTGADLTEVGSALGQRDRIAAFLALFHRATGAIATAEVPVIAAVQGYALAGGLELALACDLIVAADTAEFGDQHINVGLVPGGGGSQRLPRAIGTRRSLALQLTGDRITAEQALAWGLVHSVHPAVELRDAAIRLAGGIAARDRAAVRRIRDLHRVASTRSLHQGLPVELAMATAHLSGLDVAEGLARFTKK